MTDTQTNTHSESVHPDIADGIEVREPVKAPIEADDPDALDIAAAREEIAKAGQPAAPATEPEPAVPAAAATEPKPAEPPKPAAQPDQMIPKARLDEVLKKQGDLERRNAFLEGALSAVTPPKAEPAAPATPEPPKRTIDQIEAEKLTLADQFDQGKISAKEWREKESALDREARALTERPAAAAAPAQGDELFLEALTQQLEQKHPYSTLITDDADWTFIEAKARQQLTAGGKSLTDSAADTLLLRQKMAELTDVYGPTLTGKSLKKSAPAGTGTPPANPPAASPTAAARAAKLGMAESMPPDISNLGGSPASGTEISDTALMNMSDDEIGALPEATRRRILKT
jgi:hypothetical protein